MTWHCIPFNHYSHAYSLIFISHNNLLQQTHQKCFVQITLILHFLLTYKFTYNNTYRTLTIFCLSIGIWIYLLPYVLANITIDYGIFKTTINPSLWLFHIPFWTLLLEGFFTYHFFYFIYTPYTAKIRLYIHYTYLAAI